MSAPPTRLLDANERPRRRRAKEPRLRRRRVLALASLAAFLTATAVITWWSSPHAHGHSAAIASVRIHIADARRQFAVPGTKANEPRSGSTVRSTAVASTPGGLAGKIVAIDPGHNGHNYLHTAEIDKLVPAGGFMKACDTTGTETAGGYTEAAYTLDLAERLAQLLRRDGATVVLTRTSKTPWGPCINQRAAIGNRAHADAAISIHADGGPISGRGFHVIYPPNVGITRRIAASSARLALDVRDEYKSGTGMPYADYIGHNGLDVRSDLGGLNLSMVPKVFIETGNMRNPTDATLLETAAFRNRAAQALARGLEDFLR